MNVDMLHRTCSDELTLQQATNSLSAWDGYRLGDMVMQPVRRKRAGSFHLDNFPRSIAADYLRLENINELKYKEVDYEALEQIAARHLEWRPSCAAPPGALVVHLRVGDVIDGDQNSYSVKELLSAQRSQDPSGEKWAEYSRPLSYFDRALAQVNRSAVSGVILLAGTAYSESSFGKTTKYINRIRQRFKNVQPPFDFCETRIGGDPDCAFLLLSTARHVCPAGGSFSRLATELARRSV
eukprot:TRINITY_DN3006_c0_g1_i9.p1 TRINITY_DN3006_c0_g1~~TRINITY_DN3006_c0_g1_i9.p1  ORF type:complete len:239 (-),score=28.67 TRINITY_DN3006_c0_g1_i9:261-977(-)